MNAPSTVAPHLSRSEAEYMALVAPDDAMREEVVTAIYRVFDEVGIRCTPARSTVIRPLTDAAIAAAEPHMRVRHRAELLTKMIADAGERVVVYDESEYTVDGIRLDDYLRDYLEMDAEAARSVDAAGGEVAL